MLTPKRKWLIGVPKAMATVWWRFKYRSDALKSQNVPEQIRANGMYCPACGKKQPFSCHCTYCGCIFACFVIMETAGTSGRTPSHGTSSTPNALLQNSRHVVSPNRTLFRKFSSLTSRGRAIAVSVLLLVITSTITGAIYYQRSAQKRFLQNYVMAVYGIKSGMALTGRVCEGKYAAWKNGKLSGNSGASADIDSQAAADLATVQAEVDSIIRKMGPSPVKYNEAAQSLHSMYRIYEKANTMLVSSAGSRSRCTAEITTAQDNFSHEIENLKLHMPAPLIEEFKKSSKKYDLGFMGL